MDGARLVHERRMGRAPASGSSSSLRSIRQAPRGGSPRKSRFTFDAQGPPGTMGAFWGSYTGTIAAAPTAPYICL